MSYSLKVSKLPSGAVSQPGDSVGGDSPPPGGLLLEIAGDLDFSSVPGLFAEMQPHLEHPRPLRIDLKAVTLANSAALALLIECRARAGSSGGDLEIANVPPSVEKIAEVCGVSEILHPSLISA